MEFFMAMVPPTVTHQEKKVAVRNGKPIFYEPQELKQARALLTDSLARYRPEIPMNGAVELLVKWCFPRNYADDLSEKTWYGWKVTPPDTDNLDKLLKDCMTRTGYWIDDAQVCREIIEKHLATPPGIYIRITELET